MLWTNEMAWFCYCLNDSAAVTHFLSRFLQIGNKIIVGVMGCVVSCVVNLDSEIVMSARC